MATPATPRTTARATDRPVEAETLAVVKALVTELGTLPASGDVAVHDVLDRDLGLGSLERVELLFRLEQAFGVRFPDTVLAEADTPADLVAAVLHASPARAAPSAEVLIAPTDAVAAPASARTLLDVLDAQTTRDPERVHVILRAEDGAEQAITFRALAERAAIVAGGLIERGVRAGDTVALMLPTGAAFFSAFYGVLSAGGIPVPIYPPFRADRLEEYAARQVRILDNARARLLLTFPEAERVAALLRRRVPSLDGVVAVERLAGAPRRRAPAAAEDAALIQYTSGSTGDPKGVLLSHANILANIRAFGRALALRPDDVGVSWLPLYHDMGLIGTWLGALYHGIPIVVLSPLTFLARPARWLRAIADHRATISPAPNFAFDLCVAKARDEELEGLDLSTWRLALNGSEAVSAATIDRFARRFERYGFRREAMCPVYGLAEAAVALTTPPSGRGPRVDRVARATFTATREAAPAPAGDPTALLFVACGRPLPGHEIRIVDARHEPLGERREGRVEFRGPSVTRGYFRDPERTRAVLHDGWMDSGDLGYWAEGELVLTGRRKDLIIKGGRNLYPQEVEEVVGDVPGVRKGCVAAFGVPDPAIGTERLVVLAEARRPSRALEAAVRDRVVAALGVPPDTVVIAAPGSVLKTSSGKIRRSATRDAWLAGALARPRRSARTQWLRLLATDLVARTRRAAATASRVVLGAWLGVALAATLPALWAVVLVAPRRAVDRAVRAWCRTILAAAGCRPRVEGVEHLPCGGGVILAANHASYADAVVLLAALPTPFRFVAKRELTRTPLVGAVIAKSGHLTVDRVDLARSVADAARVTATLRAGASLLVFPEGTFVRAPRLLPFRLGAFRAAAEVGCPIVPVTLRGTRDLLPAGAWLPRRASISVVVEEPIRPGGVTWRDVVELRDRVRAVIAARLDADQLPPP